MTAVYRFGRFELSPATRQLLVDNQPVPLGARAFDVLAALIERRERLVTKNELLDLVWPGLVVEENNLQTQVSALRKLLGRDAIATVPGLGYRFALETAHAVVPALTHAVTPTNNLPQQLTSFVGRELVMDAIRELLANTRFLTLVGVGGLGKTRLSLQLGAEVLDDFPDGVWFVELAPLTDEHRVAAAVASALGVKEEAGRPVIEVLVKHVKDRRMLLILDNCEHLARACAALAKHLLQSGPRMKVLASSRERLHVAGETSFPVPALAAPGMHQTIPLAALAQYEAVRLFVDRAIAARPLFKLTPQNATAVTEICHRLDGIPLAIELAATRVRAIPVETIAAHLSDSFRLLTGGDPTSLPRQRTLRACMDWSYDLLPAPERALLRRVAVFGGGWTMEAAAAIGAVGQVDEFDVLETLTHLVDKCLVTFDGERYGLLETVRQYGRDKLLESGELETTRERHRDFFLALAEEAEPQLTGTEQVKWFNRLAVEHDNLRLAIGCALQQGKADEAQRLGGALARFWGVRGHWTEGRDWLEQALEEREGVSTAVQARALRWAGNLGTLQGDNERARELYEEALAICRELGDVQGVAGALNNLGNLEVVRGDYVRGRGLYEEALAIHREMGDQLRSAIALINLGSLLADQGDHEKGTAMLEEALAICRTLGDGLHIVHSLNSLGIAAVGRNSIDAARSYLAESLLLSGEQGNRLHMIISLSGLAWVFEKNGQANVAAQLQGACTRGLEEMGGVLGRVELRIFDTTKDALMHALGEEGYQAAFVKGKELSLEQARALALIENPGNSHCDAAG